MNKASKLLVLALMVGGLWTTDVFVAANRQMEQFYDAIQYLESSEMVRENFNLFEKWLTEQSLVLLEPAHVLDNAERLIKLPEFAANPNRNSIEDAFKQLSSLSKTYKCKRKTIKLLAQLKRGARWFGRSKIIEIITSSVSWLDMDSCSLFLIEQFNSLKSELDEFKSLDELRPKLLTNEDERNFHLYLASGGVLPVTGGGFQLSNLEILHLVKKLANKDPQNNYVTIKRNILLCYKRLAYLYDNFFYTFDEYLIKPCGQLYKIQENLMDALIALEFIRTRKTESFGPFKGANFANYPDDIKLALYRHLNCNNLFHKANKLTLKTLVKMCERKTKN